MSKKKFVGNNTLLAVITLVKSALKGKAEASSLTAHIGDAMAHVSKEDREKWNKSNGGSAFECHVISTRIRDPAKPDFGLGGGTERICQTGDDAPDPA